MTNLFEINNNDQTKTNVDPNKNYYNDLVGDGKKFKDNEALAKGKLESDEFISRLQNEMAGLRQELNTRLTVEQLLDKMSTENNNNRMPTLDNNSQQNLNNQQGSNSENKNFSFEQIEELINSRLSEVEKVRVQNNNLTLVRNSLVENWGNDYVSRLKEKAGELGVGEEFLQNLAKDQPKAFLKLIDVESKPTNKQNANSIFSLPSGQTQSLDSKDIGFKPTGNRTKSFYDDLKKRNPSEYWSPATQNQMHNDAIKLGENFFDNNI